MQTRIQVLRGSLLDQDVEAIVNAANTSMRGGGGIDGAVHRAAGPELLEELIRVAPHGARTGQVVATGGHRTGFKYIFHTPGPVWRGGVQGEEQLLTNCYRNSLEAASQRSVKSLGFCSVSTGIYGFPLHRAAPIALRTATDWLEAHSETSLERIVFAMFAAAEYEAFVQALEGVRGKASGIRNQVEADPDS